METTKTDPTVTQTVTNIQAAIAKKADPARPTITADERGVHHNHRGVSIPSLKDILKEVWNGEMKKLSNEDKKAVAYSLLSSNYSEDKQFSCLILEKIKTLIDLNDVKRVEVEFSTGRMTGFQTTDLFATSVVQPWVTGSEENSRYVLQWKDSERIWLQRACCWAFSSLVKHGDKAPNFKGSMKLMDEICEVLIKSTENPVQLGVAWLLKNIGAVDKQQLCDFLERNIKYFTKDPLSIAMEKLSKTEKKKYEVLWNKKDLNELEKEVEKEALPEEKSQRKRRKNN